MENLKASIGGGLAAALVIAGLILFYNRGVGPGLGGEIVKVRTLGMDQNSSVAIVNFSVHNTSDNRLLIEKHYLEVVDQNGDRHRGMVISMDDIDRLFQYYPALGGMEFEPIRNETRLEPGESLRGLAAARFEIPKHELDMRQEIIFGVQDRRGRTAEIVLESPPQEAAR